VDVNLQFYVHFIPPASNILFPEWGLRRAVNSMAATISISNSQYGL